MEPKKNPKKDLNRKRTLFLQIGLVISLTIVFVAFEWKTYEKQEDILTATGPVQIDQEIVQITQQEQPEPPKAPQVTTILEVVGDDEIIQDEIDISIEDRPDQAAQTYVPVLVEEAPEPVAEEIFTFVEEYPEFPGGEKALYEYIKNNIRYPEVARTSGITGTVYVQFVVEKDGSISDVKVLRGIGGGCDEEAVRVVKSMPKWKPGKQRGQPVRVYYTLPIDFKLM
ncbi:MAG: energy transducer TonB [Bacteroidales bacterium]|jgi:protein TonB|nr:energy transducer TonB [Bacteroidales bacterium]MDI9575211.1 energy transducer TonB [Bacteroidota bacterium]MDD3756000.1 energy transducer TonB [Bacteroidales bacterium]MDY0400971.1 energy transducer TonB [Bacteroidales bacterium]HHW60134.1 energy transducer TonB [Bacteroidales bacterium]